MFVLKINVFAKKVTMDLTAKLNDAPQTVLTTVIATHPKAFATVLLSIPVRYVI